MSMLYNGKTWYEMTPEEQKVYLIIVGIMVLALFIYGIYYFIKKRKDIKALNCGWARDIKKKGKRNEKHTRE